MNSSLLWLGLLPVLVFLLLGSLAGPRQALWGALAIGVAEMAFTWIKFRTLDYVSGVSFALLAVFIVLSLRTRNDFWFKIHGAIINLLSAAVLLVAWYFFHQALLLDMAVKYVGLDRLASLNPAMSREIMAEMLRVLSLHLPWWLILHALVTVYAATNWSKWAWGFVSVPGFFIMLFLASNFAGAVVLGN